MADTQVQVQEVETKETRHYLKLRHSFAVNDRLRAEYGYDFKLRGDNGRAWGSLLFQLDPGNEDEGFLEVNNDNITVNKKFDLKLKKLSVAGDYKLGVTTQGKPYAKVNIQSVPLMLVGAAVLLLLNKPIVVTKKEAGFSLDVDLGDAGTSSSLQERAEVDCTLRRQGRGLALDVHEFNGVLRLWQGKAK